MKRVVYTQRVEIVESYQERRDCSDQRIPKFIRECGYLPIGLPNTKNIVEEIMIDVRPVGIVLSGGNSLVVYGGQAPERDEVDTFLIKYAIDNRIPLYGFCRGMQSILHYFNNQLDNVKGHVAVQHMVIGQSGKYVVNSYHNQACKELSKECELKVIARAEDEVIEEIQHKVYPIRGTMWHPERETVFSKDDINRVRELFK